MWGCSGTSVRLNLAISPGPNHHLIGLDLLPQHHTAFDTSARERHLRLQESPPGESLSKQPHLQASRSVAAISRRLPPTNRKHISIQLLRRRGRDLLRFPGGKPHAPEGGSRARKPRERRAQERRVERETRSKGQNETKRKEQLNLRMGERKAAVERDGHVRKACLRGRESEDQRGGLIWWKGRKMVRRRKV